MPKFLMVRGVEVYLSQAVVIEAPDGDTAVDIAMADGNEDLNWIDTALFTDIDGELADRATTYFGPEPFDPAVDPLPVEAYAFCMTPRERDTVMAALRLWQRTPRSDKQPELEIALNERPATTEMSDEEIDHFIEEELNGVTEI